MYLLKQLLCRSGAQVARERGGSGHWGEGLGFRVQGLGCRLNIVEVSVRGIGIQVFCSDDGDF